MRHLAFLEGLLVSTCPRVAPNQSTKMREKLCTMSKIGLLLA
jgi:hypothetical protein